MNSHFCNRIIFICMCTALLLAAIPSTAFAQNGACCVDGSCTDTTQFFCDAVGGIFVGEETICEENGAVCDIGACCTDQGCVALSQIACGQAGGTAFEPNTECGEGACGACCLPEGGCEVTNLIGCLNTDGAIYNADQLCEGEVCGPPPTGACCQEAGCVDGLSQADCLNAGGSWGGPNTDCTTDPTTCNPGECCIGTNCLDLIAADCLNQGGVFTAGVSCGEGSCPEPVGACCGETFCLETIEANCTGPGREFLGVGTTCEEDCIVLPDPTGACCLIESGCVDGLTASDCSGNDGIYLGDNSMCEGTNACDFGACCRSNNCVEDFRTSCVGVGGEFVGVGTTCQPEDPCGGGPQTGACCRGTGACENDVTAAECSLTDDVFLGIGTVCAPGVCDLGACCSPAGCMEISETQCNQLGDSVFYDGATCQENPCAPGACCAGADGTNCVENIDPWNCTEALGRTFQGPGTTCESNPCVVPCGTCPGDMDGNSTLDGLDIAGAVDCLLAASGGAPTSGCECGDMNGDDLLDIADIALMADAYVNSGGSCP